MLIDWFTVAAQAVNFLLLVWLLKRFLYAPILRAIDAREQRIAAELSAAAAKMAAADQQRDEYQQKLADFEQHRADQLQQSTKTAQAEGQRLLEAARQAADTLSAQRAASLSNQAALLKQTIASRARQQVFNIARQTLHDLAGVSLEERIIAAFMQRLAELEPQRKAELAAQFKAGGEPAVIRSAFALSAPQCQTLEQAVQLTFGLEAPLQFTVDAELIGGIELIANGRKLAWTIDDYLTTLETGLAEVLQAPLKTELSQPNPDTHAG